MPHAADASPLPVLLGRLSVHQDLLWFGSLVCWSLVIACWWRHPVRDSLWRWLPWFAGAGMLGSLVPFMVFNLPFDLFLEILVPGSNALYEPAALDPFLTADLMLATFSHGLVFLWWWEQTSRWHGRAAWRGLGLAALVVVLAVHYAWPGPGSWLLVLLPLVFAINWPGPVADRRTPRWLRFLPALVPACSTIGPIAWHGDMMQRTIAATPLGALAAFLQLLVAGLLLVHLRCRRSPDAPGGTGSRHQVRPFFLVAAGLLALGVSYALVMGEEQRREVIGTRLRATMYNAGLLEPAAFSAFTTPQFRLEDIQESADGTGTARAPGFEPVMAAAARALAARVRATQFQKSAGFLVLRDGWLVEVAGTTPRPHPATVLLRGRSTADDQAAWREKRLFVRYSPVPEQGAPYYCRAPLLGPDGRMLGWLESPREEFFASLARKWRTGPLLITALAVWLVVALYFQNQASLERERAARTAAVSAEASRVKTAFLAKVSHELRTPIQSLLGYSELLRHRVAGDTHTEAWLNAIAQHGELMTRLVNDLIDLSAVEAGTFRLAPRPLVPAELVQRTVESLRPRAEARQLALRYEFGPGLPDSVEADGERLRQLVLNLVGNAVKFTDRGGVTIALDGTPAGGGHCRLVLAVRDTGPGIPAAERHRLFTAFSRLEFTAHKEGSGLGLALCAALCAAMDGTLAVESDGATGSCFTATLLVPLAAPPATVSTPAIPSISLHGRRVLVVDDNTLVRELFVTFLTEQGMHCTAAASAAAALAALHAAGADAVVLDLALPDEDGTRLVPRLRHAAPGLRIVGVSAHAGAIEREQALAAGMDAFLAKPVALADLAAALAGGNVTLSPPTGSPGLRKRLEREFRRELPDRRAALASAIAAGDRARARDGAHYLANSAAVLHDEPLLQACAELVEAADRADPKAIATHWAVCEALLASRQEPESPVTA